MRARGDGNACPAARLDRNSAACRRSSISSAAVRGMRRRPPATRLWVSGPWRPGSCRSHRASRRRRACLRSMSITMARSAAPTTSAGACARHCVHRRSRPRRVRWTFRAAATPPATASRPAAAARPIARSARRVRCGAATRTAIPPRACRAVPATACRERATRRGPGREAAI